LSLIGGFKLPGVSSSAEYSTTIGNFIGFPISGHTDSNAIAVCNYSYDYTNKMWKPTTWS